VNILRKRQSSDPVVPWRQLDPNLSASMVTEELAVWGKE